MDNGEIILYQSPQGDMKIDVRLQDETVWLSQRQIAELFQTTPQNITLHLKNIYAEGELQEDATCKDFLQVQKEGRRNVQRSLTCYNLDVIISIGYRVKSTIATRFRIWATQRLKEYLIKGFVLDDERLKLARNNYFDELLSRIRDIRSSEKVFYRKVCEIYATSADYDPSRQKTLDFFATVQNKFHWAVTGKTAAEILVGRADATKPNMGLTNWPGESIKKQDTEVAKNYLNAPELDQLNRLVNQYLEFAELQAINRKVMHMDDWIGKLHGFLTLNEKQILQDAGRISAQLAKEHVHREYEKYQKMIEETLPDELDKALKRLDNKNE
ncbi:MAG: virulence RhuM family protein [Bacteroidota bacterium]